MTDFAPPRPTEPASPPRRPDNGHGVAALVLGIVAIAGFTTWFGFPLALLAAILAIVFGVKGRRKADAGAADNRGQATAGLVLGVVTLSLAATGATAYTIWNDEFRDWDRHDSFSECVDDADGTGDLRECLAEYPDDATELGFVVGGDDLGEVDDADTGG